MKLALREVSQIHSPCYGTNTPPVMSEKYLFYFDVNWNVLQGLYIFYISVYNGPMMTYGTLQTGALY